MRYICRWGLVVGICRYTLALKFGSPEATQLIVNSSLHYLIDREVIHYFGKPKIMAPQSLQLVYIMKQIKLRNMVPDTSVVQIEDCEKIEDCGVLYGKLGTLSSC
ncbi:uncharacterized protein LOC122018795 isoform X2 [Zingiber officinale]|uniref:uncharacterized protein LOC122018795 isoform X2 n=1 Tax=Zingiber officinale TaxID=94328 RepID=UPI001C4ACEA9|nr:uncharacterized protein LOC122018795 isoform X2 [Zingiber officinale]